MYTNVHTAKRHPYDAYATPAWVTARFLAEFGWDRPLRILEPCAGDGAICRVLREWCPDAWIEAVELRPECGPALEAAGCNAIHLTDFLAWEGGGEYDLIITNPPFSAAEAIVRHAARWIGPKTTMAFLVRLGFLASRKRRTLWAEFPPDALFVLSERPSFTEDGKTDGTDYGWVVWNTRPGIVVL